MCASSSGRCQHREAAARPAASRRRRSASTGSPHSVVTRARPGCRWWRSVKQNVGRRAVVLAQPPQPAQHVRDVAAEDAAQRVQLVDDDVAQPHEERRPAVVRREDAHVQHLGVGEHDVGVRADPRAVVGGRVAVVGGGDERRAPATRGSDRSWSWASALVGNTSSAVSRLPRDDDVDDRQLVAERLARRGAGGDDDVATGAQRVDRGGLVRPQARRCRARGGAR